MMKVSQLRGIISEILISKDDLLELDTTLKRFDSMDLSKFCALVRGIKVPKTAPVKATGSDTETISNNLKTSDVATRIMSLKTDPQAFDAEIEALGRRRSFTKKDLIELYSIVYKSKSKLPMKLSKNEMVARFKRQRRRDANFASA